MPTGCGKVAENLQMAASIGGDVLSISYSQLVPFYHRSLDFPTVIIKNKTPTIANASWRPSLAILMRNDGRGGAPSVCYSRLRRLSPGFLVVEMWTLGLS